MTSAHIRRLSIALALGSIVSAANAQDAYKITPIGRISATAINNYGQVCGLNDLNFKATLWTPTSPNGTTGALIDFDLPTGYLAYGFKVNDKGQVAGAYYTDTSQYSANGTAFLWTPNTANGTVGTFSNLNGLAGPAFGLNNLGQVTVGQVSLGGTPVNLWTPTQPNGPTGSYVPIPNFENHTLNSYGQVAGDGLVQSGIFFYNRAGVWTPTTPNGSTGNFSFIDVLVPEGESYVGDINTSGQIVGQSETDVFAANNNYYVHAFVWTPSSPNSSIGNVVDIDPVPDRSSSAFRINDKGDVVGYYTAFTNGVFDPHPFLYTNGQFKDLETIIPAGSGIVFSYANDINDKGQIVVAGGLNGQGMTFLLTPIKTDAAVVELEVNVNNLVINGALLPANGQSLYAKLKAAQQKINAGDNAGAITDLNAFINQVKAFIKTGKLSQANGQALIDAANAIINYLKS